MARPLILCLLVLLASSPLAGGILEYLVIVNKSGSELVVSYRVGAFTGPDFQQFVMLMKPMHSPGAKYAKIGKYWPLPEEQVLFRRGILTFSISPDTGMMVGGIWRGAGAEEANVVSPHLEIEGPNETFTYEGMKVFSAFDRRSKEIRMLVVE
jgi:hypothetical protein